MRISDWSSDVCSSDLKLFGKICRKLAFEWGAIRIEGGGRETANGRAGARLINMGILVDELVLQPFKGPDDDARPERGFAFLVGAVIVEQGFEIGRAAGRERVCT